MSIVEADVEMWLDMTDGSGATVTDASTNGNDATLQGTYSWGTTGLPSGLNNWIEFNGTNTKGVVPSVAGLNPGTANFSMSGWIYTDNFNARQGLYWKGNVSTDWYMLSIGGSGFGGGGEFLLDDGSDIDFCRGGTINSNGTWYHLVGVRTATQMILYINGVAVQTVTDSNGDITHSNPLEIGFAAPDNAWLNGRLGQVVHFNRDLTASEVTDLYASGNGKTFDDYFGGGGGATANNNFFKIL